MFLLISPTGRCSCRLTLSSRPLASRDMLPALQDIFEPRPTVQIDADNIFMQGMSLRAATFAIARPAGIQPMLGLRAIYTRFDHLDCAC